MENKEMKKPIPEELNEEELDTVAGGVNKLTLQNVYKVLMNYMSSYEKARYESLSHLLEYEGRPDDLEEIMTMLRTAFPDLALDKELVKEILSGYYDG